VLIIDGTHHHLPDLETLSWLDDPKRAPRIRKTTPRARTLRSIFVHTTKGKLCPAVKPGASTRSSAFAEARYQTRPVQRLPDGKVIGAASFDCVIGQDGVVLWLNDPVAAFTWHARQVNAVSLGIELCQDIDGSLYQATIDSACVLVVFLCEVLGLQKQVAWNHVTDRPYAGRIERMDPGRNGADCIGVFGHRNVWVPRSKTDPTLVAARGHGDPNDFVFTQLAESYHFERFDYNANEDRDAWRKRQASLGIVADGIPLKQTVFALRADGWINGIWADGKSTER
jgi:hypothetical protein